MNKVALIIPYYGALPPYFGLFLKSLRPIHLDVLFVTDLEVRVPSELTNFKVLKISFAELQRQIRETLDQNAVLVSTRKLCDYKPFFGKLFEKYLVEYLYWAHGDCDLIYGEKFNEVLNEIVQGDYDVASMRQNWMSGSFSAFKNNERMRNLYINLENWREVCGTERNLCFDECVTVRFKELLSGKMTVHDCYREAGDSLSALIWRTPNLKFFHKEIMCEDTLSNSIVSFRKGHIYLDKKEIAAFHYIGLKYRRYFSYLNVPYDRLGGELWIDDTGFYMSRFTRSMRPIIRLFKKMCALIESFRVNGFQHWYRRILKK